MHKSLTAVALTHLHYVSGSPSYRNKEQRCLTADRSGSRHEILYVDPGHKMPTQRVYLYIISAA